MKKIAISGNIASGKSTVQRIIIEKGYKVLDTDEVSHDILSVKNKNLYEAFKNYDVFENGEFSRKKVGNLIFSDMIAKQKIESIMHLQITEKIKDFFANNKNEEMVFVGIPLLFEANMEYLFDKIIFIYTNDNIRLERLIKRNNYTIEYAKKRIECQINQDKKVSKSDFLIYNNGTKKELIEQTEKVLNNITLF